MIEYLWSDQKIDFWRPINRSWSKINFWWESLNSTTVFKTSFLAKKVKFLFFFQLTPLFHKNGHVPLETIFWFYQCAKTFVVWCMLVKLNFLYNQSLCLNWVYFESVQLALNNNDHFRVCQGTLWLHYASYVISTIAAVFKSHTRTTVTPAIFISCLLCTCVYVIDNQSDTSYSTM